MSCANVPNTKPDILPAESRHSTFINTQSLRYIRLDIIPAVSYWIFSISIHNGALTER